MNFPTGTTAFDTAFAAATKAHQVQAQARTREGLHFEGPSQVEPKILQSGSLFSWVTGFR